MVGYGVNKGIIPMVCSDMFKTVEKGEGGKKYQVMTTMLEIYNECIRVSWDATIHSVEAVPWKGAAVL